MNYTTVCFLRILKIPFSDNSIFGLIAVNGEQKPRNVCKVNLTPHTVYLIAAVPEMRDGEERVDSSERV